MEYLTFKSRVHRGQGIASRELLPTANLDPNNISPRLKHGVYAALVNFSGKMYPAMFHFGVRSTDNTISAEVHLLDVNLDLLDREITITPIKFIRDVGEFQDLQDLKKQLALDLVQIVKYV